LISMDGIERSEVEEASSLIELARMSAGSRMAGSGTRTCKQAGSYQPHREGRPDRVVAVSPDDLACLGGPGVLDGAVCLVVLGAQTDGPD
jgi:hypothetical protein